MNEKYYTHLEIEIIKFLTMRWKEEEKGEGEKFPFPSSRNRHPERIWPGRKTGKGKRGEEEEGRKVGSLNLSPLFAYFQYLIYCAQSTRSIHLRTMGKKSRRGGGKRKMNTQRHTRTNTRTRVYKRLPRRRYDCKVAIKLRKIYCKYIKGGKGMDEKMDWVGKRWKIGSTSNPMDALYSRVRGIISL